MDDVLGLTLLLGAILFLIGLSLGGLFTWVGLVLFIGSAIWLLWLIFLWSR